MSAWALALAALLVGGCSGSVSFSTSAVVVYEPPPDEPPRPPPPAAPGEEAVWAEGHWRWSATEGWQWEEGRWIPERPGHVYAQAHWQRRGRGWIYVPARWVPVEE